jgi:hypothetical protein
METSPWFSPWKGEGVDFGWGVDCGATGWRPHPGFLLGKVRGWILVGVLTVGRLDGDLTPALSLERRGGRFWWWGAECCGRKCSTFKFTPIPHPHPLLPPHVPSCPLSFQKERARVRFPSLAEVAEVGAWSGFGGRSPLGLGRVGCRPASW